MRNKSSFGTRFPGAALQTYTPAKLGSKRVKTPEGFLLCKDVVFARTGELIYGAGEIPVKPGLDGRARVTRDASVVFDPATLDSMPGKSVTVRHPPTLVGSHDWRTVEAGTILTARRGAGDMAEYMLGDVIIKDASTVDMMEQAAARGERIEVSLGYVANYKDDGGGRGRQTKITGNHLAILPPGVRGRCGPECYVGDEESCYIGDQAMDFEEPKMTEKTTGGLAILRRILGAKTEDEAVLVLDEAARDEATNQLVGKLTGDIEALKAQVAALTKDAEKSDDDDKDDDEDEKKAKMTADAAHVAATLPRVKSAAEILAPGLTFPTYDSTDASATLDAMCACQRAALTKALERPEGKHAVEAMFGAGADLSKVSGATLDSGFFGAAALIGALNNNTLTAMAMARGGGGELATAQQRAIDADARSQARWGKNKTTV